MAKLLGDRAFSIFTSGMPSRSCLHPLACNHWEQQWLVSWHLVVGKPDTSPAGQH
ncbi:MAG: hypothetical protein ACAF41_11700 [Leptolyngbya sp. BL-A-14]